MCLCIYIYIFVYFFCFIFLPKANVSPGFSFILTEALPEPGREAGRGWSCLGCVMLLMMYISSSLPNTRYKYANKWESIKNITKQTNKSFWRERTWVNIFVSQEWCHGKLVPLSCLWGQSLAHFVLYFPTSILREEKEPPKNKNTEMKSIAGCRPSQLSRLLWLFVTSPWIHLIGCTSVERKISHVLLSAILRSVFSTRQYKGDA